MIGRFATLGVARLVAAAVQALALIVVARLVSVAEFGELSVIIAVLSFVFIAASAGLPQFILRERSLGSDDYVLAGLRANLLTSAIAGIVIAIVAVVVLPASYALVALGLVVAIGVDKTVDCQLSVPLADGQMRVPAMSILGRALTFAAGFTVALIVTGGEQATAVYAAARLVSAAFAVAHMAIARSRVGAAPLAWSRLAAALWPMAASNLVSALRTLDSFVVFLVGGSTVAGFYSAGSRPFAPAAIVAGAAGAVLMPHSATASWPALASHLRRLRLLAAGVTVLLIPLALLGPQIAVFVYGGDYESAGAALGICMLVVPAVILAAIVATVLQARGEERFVVTNGLVFLVVFIVGLVVGVMVAGATGAAIGFALSVWGRNAGLSWGLRRLRLAESSPA